MIKIKKDILERLIVDCISDEIIEEGEWENEHKIIFEYEGKFWSCLRSVAGGACFNSWDGEDEIECFEVIPLIKTITVWEEL